MTDITIPVLSVSKNGNIIVNTKQNNCRYCRYFIRVHEDKAYGYEIAQCRGFCALGNDGNFSLYTRSYCDRIVFSSYSIETAKIEEKICELKDRIYFNSHDRRTKEYKCIESFIEMTKKKVESEKMQYKEGFYAAMKDQIIVGGATNLYVSSIFHEQISWLSHRKHMTRKEYDKLIGFIRLTIINQIEPILENEERDIEICQDSKP